MGWKDTDDGEGGKYIKFKPGMQVTVQILDYPTPRNFEGDDGKEVESYDLPVLMNGEEKVIGLSSKRLRRALAAMDDMRPMVNTWCAIKATGEGFQRAYQVVPLLSAPEGQEDEDEEGINAMQKRIAAEEAAKEAAAPAPVRAPAPVQAIEKAPKTPTPHQAAETTRLVEKSKASEKALADQEEAAAHKRAIAARQARERRARKKAEAEAEEADDE